MLYMSDVSYQFVIIAMIEKIVKIVIISIFSIIPIIQLTDNWTLI